MLEVQLCCLKFSQRSRTQGVQSFSGSNGLLWTVADQPSLIDCGHWAEGSLQHGPRNLGWNNPRLEECLSSPHHKFSRSCWRMALWSSSMIFRVIRERQKISLYSCRNIRDMDRKELNLEKYPCRRHSSLETEKINIHLSDLGRIGQLRTTWSVLKSERSSNNLSILTAGYRDSLCSTP